MSNEISLYTVSGRETKVARNHRDSSGKIPANTLNRVHQSDRKTNACNQWKRLTAEKVISRSKLPYVIKATKAKPPRQLLCGLGVLTKAPPGTPVGRAPEC